MSSLPRVSPSCAIVALLIASAATGCRLDDTRPSAARDAASTLDVAAGADAIPPDACVLVTTSEFGAAGALAAVSPRTLEVHPDVVATHHDAVVRVVGGVPFIINREGVDGDNIQRLDPSAGLATDAQWSVGNGTNPWDLAVEQGAGVVTRYNPGDLLPVNLLASSEDELVDGDPVPLPTTHDDDGRAEPGGLLAHAGVFYVLLQGLDNYPWCDPDSRGAIVAYDARTLSPAPVFGDAFMQPLRACNPTTFVRVEDRLYVGLTGNHRSRDGAGGRRTLDDDGGIELLDLATGASLGLVASETELGGRDVLDITAGDSGRLWVALGDASFEVSIHELHLEPGATELLGAAVWSGEGIFDVAEQWGRLWIADRTPSQSGVVVLDAETGEQLSGDRPLPTGRPPFNFAFAELPGGCPVR